jgi:DNA-binding XRE family transcriptional regulator
MKIRNISIDLIYQVNYFFLWTELSCSMANNRNEKVLKNFGENLKKIRESKGLTTRQFADLAEIAYSQVWVLESGKGDPSLTTLLTIAKALDISLDALVNE